MVLLLIWGFEYNNHFLSRKSQIAILIVSGRAIPQCHLNIELWGLRDVCWEAELVICLYTTRVQDSRCKKRV